ncbi:hypothetical protein [Streptomyces sp. NBC_01767]|uniref:hypothetical protein n=1 Tax=unclassified Streptomyces TaxID=2593676 RepID=UPI0022547F1C|nr:hypothetical protein [Streptomyces sp. NBC_01767]MCX4399357.1 hypothetical protein [Streptomyces sp. NBC_01767]WSG48547.1 hypothetical protein OHA38_01160 [Streptomyces sp. NBC_01732]
MEQRRERADERQPSPSGSRFLYFAVPAISRHMFRTVEIRQALPALITVAPAWELALQDIFLPLNDWPDVPALVPLGGALAATRSPPASCAASTAATACASAG